MKITVELTVEESESIFHDILCNCISMGYLNGYGLELDYNRDYYRVISDGLKKNGNLPCHEDVLMAILRDGGRIKIMDVECDGEYSKSINLKDIHEKIQKAPVDNLQKILDETGDVLDCDVVLQYMLYGKIIFG